MPETAKQRMVVIPGASP